MRTDPKQSDENREEAGLEEALKLWMEIRQVDRKKGWERLEAEIGRQYGLRRQERRRRLGYFQGIVLPFFLFSSLPVSINDIFFPAIDHKIPVFFFRLHFLLPA